MPKVSVIQSSFNSGEISPLMYAQSGNARYKNGLAVCLNALVLAQGAWTRRGGTHYVAPTKGNGVARLVKFEFSTTQAYIIELGNLYARFYMNHAAILESAKNITAATQANPCVITSNAHGFANGDDVEIAGVVGMTQLNGRRFTVAGVAANTFQLNLIEGGTVDSTAFGAYVSGGTVARVYTIATPYVTADLFQLRFAQSADTLYVAHKNYIQKKITRTSHTNWTIGPINQFGDGPYLATNSTAITMTASGTTGGITITASSAVFVATDTNRLMRMQVAGVWGNVILGPYTSSTSMGAQVIKTLGGVAATANWRLGAWSDTTGYPSGVAFNEDRLCFGGPTLFPQRIDASNTGDYENFTPTAADGTVVASNAIGVTLNANDVNATHWLQDDEKGLLVGTVSGEWIVRPSTLSESISPTNIVARRSVSYGSADVAPVRVGKVTLYLQRAARKLRELVYVFQDDGFRAPDMTLISEHITLGGIKEIAYQQETQSIVWLVRNDGVLVGFTYERDQEVIGWHRHILGGFSDAGQQVSAKVESVACIPAPDGTRDDAWVLGNRYINGVARRYVEWVNKPWERGDAQADAFHVDSGLSLANTIAQTLTPGAGANVDGTTGVVFTAGGAIFSAGDVNRYIHYDYTDSNGVARRASALVTAFTDTTHVQAKILFPWPNLNVIAASAWRMTVQAVGGLWHLEGQVVSVFADGATQPSQTVVSGTIALTYPASKITVGLGYNSDGQRLRDDAGAADGTAQGKIRRPHKVKFRFHDTLGIKIGPSFDKLVQKPFRTSANPMGVAPPLFSGDKVYEWEGDYDTEGYVCWRQDQPEPATVLAIMPQLNTQDSS